MGADRSYVVRTSEKARHVRLLVKVGGGLTVVVPVGFESSLIPGIIEGKRAWLERSRGRFASDPAIILPHVHESPTSITLSGIYERWDAEYVDSAAHGVRVVERKGSRLLVSGRISSTVAVRDGLTRWLRRTAYRTIVPWLEDMSREMGLPFASAEVRRQRTRWASCSARRSISLNVRLLFLPRPLVRYALIHELAHTREMNHSVRFWNLLRSLEPDYAIYDSEIREARSLSLVPPWLGQGLSGEM